MKEKRGNRKVGRLLLLIVICCCLAGALAVFGVNGHVKNEGGKFLVTSEEAQTLTDVDCILVLGCQVKEEGRPSAMLSDRLKKGIELYQAGVAPKLLMSGDHGRTDYDEVATMKRVAVEAGVPSEDVFKDHAGFSTYESIYRAKEIFGVRKMVIVTQKYHLYRALYIAEKLGVEAYGVDSDYFVYAGQSVRDLREILARDKDFLTTTFRTKPKYLGEAIPITGNGDVTD